MTLSIYLFLVLHLFVGFVFCTKALSLGFQILHNFFPSNLQQNVPHPNIFERVTAKESVNKKVRMGETNGCLIGDKSLEKDDGLSTEFLWDIE